jgi:hypothetical protein
MFDIIDNTAVQNVVLNDTQTTAAQADQVVVQAPASLTKVLGNMEAKRIAWEDGAYRTSNQALYAVLADCLTFAGELSDSALAKARSAALEAFYKERGYRYKKETPLATRVVRAVFGGIDRRRVSTYSLVLREAQKQKVFVQNLAQWIEDNGGIQEIRLSQSATFLSPKMKAQTAQAASDALPDLAVVKSEALAEMTDADFMGEDCVLLARQNTDGSYAVRAVLRSSGLVSAAYTALYAQQKQVKADAAKEKQAANDADGSLAAAA